MKLYASSLRLVVLFISLYSVVGKPLDFSSADQAFRNRYKDSQARLSLESYREVLTKHPESVEASWRFAMACQFVGMRLETDKEKKTEIFKEGKNAALDALEIDETCAECHFWAAINMSLYGDTVGPMKMLFTLGTIRRHLNRSIELDPTYAFAGAYRVLALIDWKLPGILGGDNDRALGYLRKAVALFPDEPLNYSFLAKLLNEEKSHSLEALAIGVRFRQLPEPPLDYIESREAWQELRNLFPPTNLALITH